MSRIYKSIDQLIGHTPLLQLTHLQEQEGLGAQVVAKLEYFNPAGSVKDRVAREMIENFERSGRLGAGGTIIEPTSGNTGIGLAMLAAAKGYRAIIVMPDSMSAERRSLMRAYGAEVVLSDGALGMSGAIERARQLCGEIPGSMVVGQFTNPANPAAHQKTTGPELYEDTDGQIDVLVAGVGTGGTLTGVSRYLKERIPHLRVVAVEPADSPVLSGGKGGAHTLQGIGAGFVPDVLDTSCFDVVMTVTHDDAVATMRDLAAREGLLVGLSSGAAAFAALQLARRPEYAGKTIAVILPDGGERYLSTGLFEEA